MNEKEAKRRAGKRADKERKREAARKAAKLEQERKDENLSPAIQRLGQPGYSQPRVVRNGVSFIVSSPVWVLIARSKGKIKDGRVPLFEDRHGRAADLLAIAWQEGGEGIGMASTDLGSLRSPSGRVPAGFSDELLRRMRHQQEQHALCARAAKHLGSHWPAVKRIAIDGIDVAVLAAELGWSPDRTAGYLRGGLDRLVEFFAPPDKEKEERQGRIRAAEIVPSAKPSR